MWNHRHLQHCFNSQDRTQKVKFKDHLSNYLVLFSVEKRVRRIDDCAKCMKNCQQETGVNCSTADAVAVNVNRVNLIKKGAVSSGNPENNP